MEPNWVTSLDMLAMNNVIDFDAAAFLHGTQPRYVGNPLYRVPQMASQMPPMDTFDGSKDHGLSIDNPTWKKVLFGGVALATLIFGGYKLKNSKVVKWLTGKHPNLTSTIKKPFQWIGDKCTKLWNWVKKPFTKKTP